MQVPEALDRFHERSPDDEACLQALPRARWPGGFVCPELDESYLGRTVSDDPGGRGALDRPLLRRLQEFSYPFDRRAKEDE